jgi:hypothetical protein
MVVLLSRSREAKLLAYNGFCHLQDEMVHFQTNTMQLGAALVYTQAHRSQEEGTLPDGSPILEESERR